MLRDPNIAGVVAACTQDEPLCLLSEFSEYGDLCQFLRTQPYSNDLNTSLSSSGGGSSTASPSGGLKYVAVFLARVAL